jgi:hypothetical protein
MRSYIKLQTPIPGKISLRPNSAVKVLSQRPDLVLQMERRYPSLSINETERWNALVEALLDGNEGSQVTKMVLVVAGHPSCAPA